MGTPGHPWAFSWNLPCFDHQTVQSWAVLWDRPLLSGQFTAKCPRTQGAAYYNFLTIIWYYSKILSDTVSKKILQTPPWGLHHVGWSISKCAHSPIEYLLVPYQRWQPTSLHSQGAPDYKIWGSDVRCQLQHGKSTYGSYNISMLKLP